MIIGGLRLFALHMMRADLELDDADAGDRRDLIGDPQVAIRSGDEPSRRLETEGELQRRRARRGIEWNAAEQLAMDLCEPHRAVGSDSDPRRLRLCGRHGELVD